MSWKRIRRTGPAILSVVLFAAALLALHRGLAEVHLDQVAAEVGAQSGWRLAGALALTVLSYVLLTFYDFLGLAYLGRRIAYPKVALASFVGYAFSNSVGHSLLVGAPVRYRLFAPWGLSALDVGKLVAYASAMMWIGFAAAAGLVFSLEPTVLPASLHLPFSSVRPLGALFLLVILAILLLSLFGRRTCTVRGFEVRIPRPAFTLAQMAIAAADWMLAGTVLYVLLPESLGLSWPAFVGMFLLAQLAGNASLVPGGIGVFESAILLLAAPAQPARLAAALVLYRLVYYLLPLAGAVALLLGREIAARRAGLSRFGKGFLRLAPAMAPPAFAIGALVAGAILLFSGALPALPERLELLRGQVPLLLVEMSHFAGSLAGAGLLLLARGLERRLGAAWLLTCLLLGVGIAASLLKGFDYEEAFALGLLLAALLPARAHFYRHSALTAEAFSPGWIAAIAIVLGGSVWLGFFAHKHVDYSHQLWWHFALDGDAPRFLRAAVGSLVVAMIFAAAHLLRAPPVEPDLPDAAQLDRAAEVAASLPYTHAYLALVGDKNLLWHPGGAAFLMYAVERDSWIAMGDPVGNERERSELAWLFRELADHHGGSTVFYQVRPENLGLYLDLGLGLLKLGEEALVPLADFSLAGAKGKSLRNVMRRAEKENISFEIVAAAQVPPLLEPMRAVSEAWLETRATREKGFSVGYFEPAYLARCPAALVRRDGQLVAFANLWPADGRAELSLDLMRHLPDAPGGVMDFLFVQLALWGREQGYARLNLGMAPLAGLQDRRLAPLWNRLGSLAFRHGEAFYHFQGLRQYKEKFDPQWEPRYLASPGGLALPRTFTHLAALIGGSLRGAFTK